MSIAKTRVQLIFMDNTLIATISAFFISLSGEQVLTTQEMDLSKRHAVPFVNEVFKDNILLTMNYLDGRVTKKEDINFDEVRKPFTYQFKLEPGQTFAFHGDVLPEYEKGLTLTTKANFNAQQGFKFSGLMYGDGVCHLASLIYKAAKQAGLDAYTPANHNFATIPQIEKEYGSAIYFMPGSKGANARQNLYVTNNKDSAVTFKFNYQDDILGVTISQEH